MGTNVTNRERMQAILAGETLDYVPSWTQSFFNEATLRRLIPADLLPQDLERFPEEGTEIFGPRSQLELDKLIAFNRHIDKVAIGVGHGTNAFGHGGPGEFNAWTVERTSTYRIVEYETGARARINDHPHFYHLFDRPVQDIADVEALELPNPTNPDRWRGFRQDVAYLKAKGQYTVGYLNGFFSGCHYFFCDHQDFLMSLISDHEMAQAVVNRLGDWNLKAAEIMLETGVDCLSLADDLGSDRTLLFSPELYDRFFFPWHRALCDLAHSYGAHAHFHSHGNITKILDRLVDSGIDMLNPLDQTEGMDLRIIKEQYGKQLTLVGGMDKFVFDQDLPEIERRLRRTVEIGKEGGRFILMDAGGIPDTMHREKFEAFLEISRRIRGQVN